MNDPGLGFSSYEGAFDRARMLAVAAALDSADRVRTKAGARHVLKIPAVRALASEAPMLRIASEYLGAGAFPFRAKLFDKSVASNWLVTWHQDTALPIQREADVAGWGPWSTNIEFANNACLDRGIKLVVGRPVFAAASGRCDHVHEGECCSPSC